MPSQPPAILTFGQTLSALMLDRRIGVAQLSRETGIDVRLVSKYKAGKVVPRDYFGDPTANARKLADALGVTVEKLIPPIATQEAA